MEEPDDIKHILGPKEQVGLYIKEKIYHPQISIDSVVITNERIILRHPHALALKRDYTDYSYSDIEGVEMEKGLLRSKIKVKLKRGGEALELDKLPTDLAEEAYGKIRENVGRFQAPFSTGNASAPVVQGSQPAQTVIVQTQPPADAPVEPAVKKPKE
ncbi:MAG: PH domain-containing protein [Methanomassiliicoccales archaeon]